MQDAIDRIVGPCCAKSREPRRHFAALAVPRWWCTVQELAGLPSAAIADRECRPRNTWRRTAEATFERTMVCLLLHTLAPDRPLSGTLGCRTIVVWAARMSISRHG